MTAAVEEIKRMKANGEEAIRELEELAPEPA